MFSCVRVRAAGIMSFLQYKRLVSEGDIVIVCKGFDKMFPLTVCRGHVIQVKGGAVHHDDLIGQSYGSKVMTSNGKGWITVLHPTPELWTLTLPHRTQIIYGTDASMITMELGVCPGCVVVEAGTGSGSLSHSLARAVAPDGRVYSYDFHQDRVKMARDEFESHGLSHVVSVECRDVCREGFDLQNIADAVFLDIPNPWKAIESVVNALKASGGRFCSFSPCIEQVQRTRAQLEQCAFVDIQVIECLQRTYEVKVHSLPVPSSQCSSGAKLLHPLLSQSTLFTAQPTKRCPGHTGYLTFATLYRSPSTS